MQQEMATSRKSTLERAQWLRAAILGANDGLLSTTSLILGIGAAKEDRKSMILSGIAGAIAGAFSMAVGEFVSVSTQRDIEKSMRRDMMSVVGQVENCSKEKCIHDNIELGRVTAVPASVFPTPGKRSLAEDNGKSDGKITDDKQKGEVDDEVVANPYLAASASALSFLFGAIVPIVPALVVTNNEMRVVAITVVASISLAVFGGVGAYLGGSPVRVSAMRVLAGGWIAMGITYGLLKIFDRDDDD